MVHGECSLLAWLATSAAAGLGSKSQRTFVIGTRYSLKWRHAPDVHWRPLFKDRMRLKPWIEPKPDGTILLVGQVPTDTAVIRTRLKFGSIENAYRQVTRVSGGGWAGRGRVTEVTCQVHDAQAYYRVGEKGIPQQDDHLPTAPLLERSESQVQAGRAKASRGSYTRGNELARGTGAGICCRDSIFYGIDRGEKKPTPCGRQPAISYIQYADLLFGRPLFMASP